MVSNRKALKESDQAMRRLAEYVDNTAPWNMIFDDLIDQFIDPVASELELPASQIMHDLFDGDSQSLAWGYIFEQMVSGEWGHHGNVIAEYLGQRGWREGSFGKSYLRALAKSKVKFWDITDVRPGKWLELRLHGSERKPRRLKESFVSQFFVPGDSIAARVLVLGQQRSLSGSSLLLSMDDVRQIQLQVDAAPAEPVSGENDVICQQPADTVGQQSVKIASGQAEEIRLAQQSLLAKLAFTSWAAFGILAKAAEDFGGVGNTGDKLLESIESGLSGIAGGAISHNADLQNNPEVGDNLQSYLTEPYRQTLDDPIPALGGKSPRECAADSKTRERVVNWLDGLELRNRKTGENLDATWMWEELGLISDRVEKFPKVNFISLQEDDNDLVISFAMYETDNSIRSFMLMRNLFCEEVLEDHERGVQISYQGYMDKGYIMLQSITVDKDTIEVISRDIHQYTLDISSVAQADVKEMIALLRKQNYDNRFSITVS